MTGGETRAISFDSTSNSLPTPQLTQQQCQYLPNGIQKMMPLLSTMFLEMGSKMGSKTKLHQTNGLKKNCIKNETLFATPVWA